MSSISLLHDINSLRHKQYNVLLDRYLTRLSRLNCVQIFSADRINLIVIQFYKYNPSSYFYVTRQILHLDKQIKLNPFINLHLRSTTIRKRKKETQNSPTTHSTHSKLTNYEKTPSKKKKKERTKPTRSKHAPNSPKTRHRHQSLAN